MTNNLPRLLRAADWSGKPIWTEEGSTDARALMMEAAMDIERKEKIVEFLNNEIKRLNDERVQAVQQATKIINALQGALALSDHLLNLIPADTEMPYDVIKAKTALDKFMSEINRVFR